MNFKLKYDPKRTIRLRKNDILNEFKTKFSQIFYETFKEAEGRIWSDKDQDFEFLEDVVNQLQAELTHIKSNLAERTKAWTNVEKVELSNRQTLPSKNIKKEPSSSPSSDFDYMKKNGDSENKASSNVLPTPDFGIPPQKHSSPKKPLRSFEDEDEFDFFED
ncbi:MAG: hypothetical protein QNJ31_07970 [Candidatus Caenarcaniphilales bacterium]|nr:hypothetical protein [Candidatus Caenarcaniphilales bacterium]